MADAEKVIQIKSLPGIKRDGTRFEGDQYVDGQWVRWQRALPRKIGGYRSINKFLAEPSTALSEYTQNTLTYIHSGEPSYLERFYIDQHNNTSLIIDRTPSGYTPDANNMWSFAIDGLADNNLVIAQVAPNLSDITNSAGGALYSGDLLGTAALTPITLATGANVTGGVVALHPYTVIYGNNGFIGWSVPGDPTDMTGAGSGQGYYTSQKIVKGYPLRGGPGNSPSGLFWAADALIRMTFVGGDTIFQFDTISIQTSIMSQNCVIEYDGVFYWCGVDRFLMFNGVVREIPNVINSNYFFDNINYDYRQRVFAFKVPRFGEIWWCYPHGDSIVCDRAIIYNIRENCWYDTDLPNGGRSSGIFPTVFRRPLLTGVLPNSSGKYKVWVHEEGVDEIDGQNIQPINSFFETADIALPEISGINKSLQVTIVEPDFVQSGDMTVQVKGRANARSPENDGPILTITESAQTPDEQINYFKTQRRELRFRFTSNVVGGDYQMGLVLAHVQPSDGTVKG